MRQFFSELSGAVQATIITLVVVVIFVAGYLGISQYAYPKWLEIQRNSVEHSKSFTDSHNSMLMTYELEYERLDTKIVEYPELEDQYKSQQKAILGKMCQVISIMQADTINATTKMFIASHGGC